MKSRLAPYGCAVLLLGSATLATAAPPLPPPESGQVWKAPGASLYYEVLGGGPGTPLVVANGGPGFDHAYLHISTVWNDLAKGRPVVLYDQRGTHQGEALKPGQTCTLADQIADLEALRDHLGYGKIDLLGHSWGGFLAMAYAARHPERIERLILVYSAAPKWTDTIFLFKDVFPEGIERQTSQDFAATLGDKAAIDAGMHEYMSMLFYSPEKRDAFIAYSQNDVYNADVNQAVNADLGRFDLNPELPKFHFPTLVLTGRFDMNSAPATAFRTHHAVAGSKFVVFEKSGHMPFYEEPEAFLKVVGDFLAGR